VGIPHFRPPHEGTGKKLPTSQLFKRVKPIQLIEIVSEDAIGIGIALISELFRSLEELRHRFNSKLRCLWWGERQISFEAKAGFKVP
jgi:hypothetical protein